MREKSAAAPSSEATPPGAPGAQRAAPGAEVRARAIAALLSVDAGEQGSQAALQTVLDKPWPLQGADRGLCTELVYGVLRRQRSLDRWLGPSCKHGLVSMPASSLAALRLGAYQLTELDRVPAFAAVDATLQALKGISGPRSPAIGFVNAVLRSVAGRAASGDRPDSDDLPPWMGQCIAEFAEDAGADPAELQAAFHLAAPTHLQLLGDGLRGRADLEQAGVETVELPIPGALLVRGGAALLAAGLGHSYLVQDAGSAAVAAYVAARPGLKVLDLCAGRGVKSAALAAQGAEVTAVDLSADKLANAQELCQQAGAPLHLVLAADASMPLPLPPESFDAVLVDAPCTGLGTLRRRPEIRHRRRAADLWGMAALQDAIADQAVRMLRPGGVLILATCSVARQEGPLWVAGVLKRHPELQLDPGDFPWAAPFLGRDGMLRTHPLRAGMDGFFAARLVKKG